MEDCPKSILSVGRYDIRRHLQNYADNTKKGEIVFEDRSYDVVETMKRINNKKYGGVLMVSLSLPFGEGYEEYYPAMKEFEKFKNCSWFGGLTIVKQACKEGLITVANESDRVAIKEVENLGAKCFLDPITNTIENNVKYFQSRL
ncbi:hypothetical protein KAI32_01650 [Candidatus Pacearchaeota archaeon]|nr:hypothetical protein [Candidatus Pacearchaeota archaeon]